MYEVFVENKLIRFAVKGEISVNPNQKVCAIELSDVINVLKLRSELPISYILIVFSKNPYKSMQRVFKDFEWIVAAGGLVRRKNSFLFIKRLDKWDLPKGKLDIGETSEIAAVREIEEECGIQSPKIKKLITTTYHTYLYKEKPVIKTNWWYLLDYEGKKNSIKPQLEEDITEVVWLKKNEWSTIKADTYPSIMVVLEKAKKMV